MTDTNVELPDTMFCSWQIFISGGVVLNSCKYYLGMSYMGHSRGTWNHVFMQDFLTNNAKKIHVHADFTQSRWMPDWSITPSRFPLGAPYIDIRQSVRTNHFLSSFLWDIWPYLSFFSQCFKPLTLKKLDGMRDLHTIEKFLDSRARFKYRLHGCPKSGKSGKPGKVRE